MREGKIQRMTWVVTCEINRGILDYYLECEETGERRGTYDCETWAQRDAEELNRQEAAGGNP